MRQFFALSAICALLVACGPGPVNPQPSGSPSGSPSPGATASPSSTTGGSASGSFNAEVTATRQAYGNYLNCINAAHPSSGAAVMANTVLNVYTDAMWVNLRALANTQVEFFTKAYGKKCGA